MFRNRFIFLISIALIISAFSSCNNNKIITVAPEAVVLGADGTGKYLTVEAPGEWVATSSADWVKLGINSGKEGVSSVYVYADKTTSARSAVLTFSSLGKSSMVSVSQTDGSAPQGGEQGGQGGQGEQGGGAASAGTYTFDFNAMGFSDQQDVPNQSKDGISISFDQAAASVPARWFSVKDGVGGVRVYAKSNFSVASSKKILKIAFTFGTQDKDNEITADCGTYSEPEWTGNSGKVVFSVSGTSGHRRIAKIAVTLSSEDSGVNPGGGQGQGGEQGGQGGEQGGEQGGGTGSGTFTDVLNVAFIGVSGTDYQDWLGKKGSASSAVYAGHTAGGSSGNESIQMRTKDNSGIISTTSGGKLTRVEVKWNSNTYSPRALDVYGNTSPYSSPADLFDSGKQGTLLGSIEYGKSTSITVSGNYAYVGLRSKENALYLDEIKITWTK